MRNSKCNKYQADRIFGVCECTKNQEIYKQAYSRQGRDTHAAAKHFCNAYFKTAHPPHYLMVKSFVSKFPSDIYRNYHGYHKKNIYKARSDFSPGLIYPALRIIPIAGTDVHVTEQQQHSGEDGYVFKDRPRIQNPIQFEFFH